MEPVTRDHSIATRELVIIAILLIVGAIALYPALRHARREVRDGIRRNEVAEQKIELEQYFNAHNTYPLEFNASPHQYVVTDQELVGARRWYLRAELENSASAIEAYDAEAGRNYYYRISNSNGHTYYDVCGGGPDCRLSD